MAVSASPLLSLLGPIKRATTVLDKCMEYQTFTARLWLGMLLFSRSVEFQGIGARCNAQASSATVHQIRVLDGWAFVSDSCNLDRYAVDMDWTRCQNQADTVGCM